MFNTTLTDEYLVCAEAFGWDAGQCAQLSLNALHASFLPEEEKKGLEQEFHAEFGRLGAKYDLA
jgi:aminodeoxyfutalosine deaminase